MSLLEIPGTFTMPVPDGQGWAVTQQGNLYELTRPRDDAALHISVYKRGGSVLGDDEASGLLSKFIASADAPPDVLVRVLKESRTQHRAVVRFLTSHDDSTFEMLSFLVLWRSRMLLCSCTASPGSAVLDEAEQMFASISPPKRGLLGRR
jgi:hypothetical protein